MIAIDISLPKRCDDCPCSYWIRTGEHEGQMMCTAMEAQRKPVSECIVDGLKRSVDCPMNSIILPRNCPACGKQLF